MKESTLVVRNLTRRMGRTILTVIGIAIAAGVLFSLLSVQAGYERQLGREVNGLGYQILAITKGCPYEAAALVIHGGVIPKYMSDRDTAVIRQIPGVSVASPLLLQQFSVNGTAHIVMGVVAEDILAIRPWWDVEGRFFTDNETRVMLVGSSLASRENLRVGQALPFGPDREVFTITGILRPTGSQEDEAHILPLYEAQRVFGKQGKITAVAVRVADVSDTGNVAASIEEIPDVQAITTAQITGTILNLVGSARLLLLVITALAVIISAAGTLNTLLMTAWEREAEMGMMKALGASSWNIARMMVLETLVITIAGAIAGIAASLALGGMIEGIVRASVPYAPSGPLMVTDLQIIIATLAFTIGIGLACAIYPVIRSARVSPLSAIRGGWE